MFVAISLLLVLARVVPASAKMAGAQAVRESAAHSGILGVAAASGMVVLLSAALVAHRRAGVTSRRWRLPWWPQ